VRKGRVLGRCAPLSPSPHSLTIHTVVLPQRRPRRWPRRSPRWRAPRAPPLPLSPFQIPRPPGRRPGRRRRAGGGGGHEGAGQGGGAGRRGARRARRAEGGAAAEPAAGGAAAERKGASGEGVGGGSRKPYARRRSTPAPGPASPTTSTPLSPHHASPWRPQRRGTHPPRRPPCRPRGRRHGRGGGRGGRGGRADDRVEPCEVKGRGCDPVWAGRVARWRPVWRRADQTGRATRWQTPLPRLFPRRQRDADPRR